MFLKAGAVSLALLVASRLLGLLRESAQAAAFGASGLADVAVLMLTLPDWVAGVLASGALSYVLLPAWAAAPQAVGGIQRRVAAGLLSIGAALALAMVLFRGPLLDLLAPGVAAALRPAAATSLLWSAACVPMALLAALWVTRLQHEREFVGMYAANLVVNGVLVAALALAAGPQSLAWLGAGLLAAMVLRLLWLAPRLPRTLQAGNFAMPPASAWVWGALAAGLPLALPVAARSIASQSGEGALATFNYAWKLVELPLMLAIQLVATLAFPGIARGVAQGNGAALPAIRSGFALAWTLGCACAGGLLIAAPGVAQLLFGWGRMDAASLATVALWARIGAWGLLPQAVIAVGITVLAARQRLGAVVVAYALAFIVLLGAGAAGVSDGARLMMVLNALLVAIAFAVVVLVASHSRAAIPASAFATAGAALLACFAFWPLADHLGAALQVASGAAAALAIIGLTAMASADLRAALRR